MNLIIIPPFFIIINLILAIAWGSKSLPLQTLRDQSSTSHCWAYAMSHLLESRALTRESKKLLINIEKDVKYWVDYERMLYIFNTKNDFYLDEYEGGWQIEYWEALLKHGRHIYKVESSNPDVWYQPLLSFYEHLSFMPELRPIKDPSLISFASAIRKLKEEIKSEKEAKEFSIDFLNRYYGEPKLDTNWQDSQIPISQTATYVLGQDYSENHQVDSIILIKPINDKNEGWAQYLNNRYWGYRLSIQKVFSLIQKSIDNGWPVTFDNVFHAMTIIAYHEEKDKSYYAVADSVPGKITWYDQFDLEGELNLVTFFINAIPDEIPIRNSSTMSPLFYSLKNIDKFDSTEIPPH